jgi:S1-C subfamily serine protease
MTFPHYQYTNIPLRALQGADRTIYYSHAVQELEHCLNPFSFIQDPRINIISILDKRNNQGGTGILLNKYGFILTSFHLVNEFKQDRSSVHRYYIRDISDHFHRIDPSFFAYDPQHDLALIRALNIPSSTFSIPISTQPLHLSDMIRYIAFVDGIDITSHVGEIKSTSHNVHYPHKIILDAIAFSGQAQRGYSGAPLFNDQNHIIGNLFGGGYLDESLREQENESDDEDEEVNFGTKGIYIEKLLQELIKNLHNTK